MVNNEGNMEEQPFELSLFYRDSNSGLEREVAQHQPFAPRIITAYYGKFIFQEKKSNNKFGFEIIWS